MKEWMAFAMASLLLLGSPLLARQRGTAERLSDDKIIEGVTGLLRWNWYWEAHPVEGYVQGKKTELAIVESPNEVAIFLAEIGISFRVGSSGRMGILRTFPSTKNSMAVDKYMADYRPTPDDVNSQPERQGEKTLPNFWSAGAQGSDSLTMDEKNRMPTVRSIPFTLPKLMPPDSILRQLKSTELPRLEAAVPEALTEWYTPEGCGKGQVVIPFFSDDDPWVDVYADLGGCGKGIFYVYITQHHDDGGWNFSPFWPNRPPDNFSSVIQKIRDHAADTIPLPINLK